MGVLVCTDHMTGGSTCIYYVWQVGVGALLCTDRMTGGSTCIYSHGRWEWEYLYVLIA